MDTAYLLSFSFCVIIICYLIQRQFRPPQARIVYHEGIQTIIARNAKECVYALNKLQSYSPQVVGFDLEWKSTPKKVMESKVCLMQIAFGKDLIVLIRLYLLRQIPMELVSFLNNPSIIKCGVSIYGDNAKLTKDYKLSMQGLVDLNDIYSEIDAEHFEVFGLNKFSLILLGKAMKYKKKINHSQWETHRLSPKQINYAANDALIGCLCFEKIFERRKNRKMDFMEFCFGKIDNAKKRRSKSPKQKRRKRQQKKKVSVPRAVECICNNKMALAVVLASDCVKNKASRIQKLSAFIVCNRCHQFIKDPNAKMYECMERKSIFCEHGYFLCLDCSRKPTPQHYEYRILDRDGELLHVCSLRMFTLFRASKGWVERLDRFTIKMRVNVHPIDAAAHANDAHFRHIAWLNTQCFVCNDKNAQTFASKIIPKWFKAAQQLLGYRVSLCSVCRSKYNKMQNIFCHNLCEQKLMKSDAKYRRIYEMKQIKKYVDAIQHAKHRKATPIGTQNEYIAAIHAFYCKYFDAAEVVDIDALMLRESELNNEIGIEHSGNDFCDFHEFPS